jgi:hypothetical protein
MFPAHRALSRLISARSQGNIDRTGHGKEVVVTQQYIVRYVGGPLDGRVDTLPELPEQPKDTVTHVHLHQGPKIVHHYDLCYAVEYGCEYRVRETD